MSKTIDEKVVEMRFDNKQFESNVATSMSTLEKLKKALKFDGASKGLEDINSAAKRVDMSGLGGAVDSVKAKFSALDVIAVTALANITNSAINTGKRLAASLSVDQITAGWQKFSDKTTSVATLVAQGNAIEDVNKQLNRLNWFTDETSYNFTDMVSNIAKFTATGKGLEESVTAMEGIATWAALSGQNAATASRAMYQLSQAMGAGVLRKEDYKSIQNASMDTEEFRKKCIEAAVALGTLKDNGNDTYSSLVATGKKAGEAFKISQFAENLTEGAWLTSDVMMKVFNEYSSSVNTIYAEAKKQDKLASEIIDEIHSKANELKTDTMSDAEAIDAAIKELGYTLEDGSLAFDSFGLKAFEAAQKARTFNDAIDSVKDAVSTGWMNTFELIFGDAEQATKLWTEVANQLWEVFAAGGERRNEILTEAMIPKWDRLTEKIEESGISVEDFEKKVIECSKAGGTDLESLIKEYGSLGEVFTAGKVNAEYLKEALDRLTGSSDDAASSVKETVKGLSVDLNNFFKPGHAITLSWGSFDTESVKKVQTALTELGFELPVYGIDGIFKNETRQAVIEFQKSVGLAQTGVVDQKTIDALIKAGNELERVGAETKKVGEISNDTREEIDSLIDGMGKVSGRDLVFSTISNILQSIVDFLGVFREAWDEVFSVERQANGIYNIISALHKFSESLLMSENTANKLKSTFKGVIAIFDILTSIVGGALKAAFDIISAVFGEFSFDALNITKNIGDVIVAFRDWLDENDVIAAIFEKVVSAAKDGIKVVKGWVKAFAKLPIVSDIIFEIKRAFTKFSLSAKDMDHAMNKVIEWFKNFKNLSFVQAILGKIKSAFVSLNDSIPKVVDSINKWFDAFKKTEGVQKLIDAVEGLIDAFKKLFTGEIDSSEFATLLGDSLGRALASLPEIAIQIAKDFIAGFQNGIVNGASNIISKIIEFCTNFVTAFASALGCHSPSVIAEETGSNFMQGFINGIKAMISSVIEIFKKVGEVVVKIFKSLWDTIADENGNIDWDKLFVAGILVSSVWFLKQLVDIFGGIANTFDGIGDVLHSVSGAVDSFSKVLNSVAWDIKAQAIQKMAISIAILVGSIWVLTQIDDIGKLWNAVGVVFALAVILAVLAFAMSKLSAGSLVFDRANKKLSLDGIKSGLLQIALALLLVTAALKMISSIPENEIKTGFERIAVIVVGMLVFVEILNLISGFSNVNYDKIGSMMIKLSFAMILMVGVCKLASMLSFGEMLKGAIFAGGFALFVGALVLATKIGNDKQLAKVSGLILSVSFSLTLMVGVCKLASMLSYKEMWKGAVFASGFAIFVAFLVNTLSIGNDKKIAKVSGLILSVSFSLMLMVGVCKLVNMLTPEEMWKGAVFAAAFAIFVGFLVNILKIGDKEKIANVASTILAISIAVAILAAVCAVLSFMDTGALIKGGLAIAGLCALMAIMIKSLKGAQNVKGSIMMMAIAIGVMAAAVIALSFIDPVSALASAAALSVMMLAFSLMIKALKGLKVGDSIKGALSLLALMVPLVAFVGILYLLNGVDGATEKIIMLTGAMAAFVIMVAVLSLVGNLGGSALVGVGLLLLLMVPLVAFVGILYLLKGVDGVKEKILALVTAMTAMTILLAVLTLIGLAGPAAVIGIGSLLAAVIAIGGLAAGIGYLMEEHSEIERFLNTGLPVLERLAGSLGTMIGNFVTGIGVAVTDGFSTMADNLSDCMDKLQEACNKASEINGDAFNGVGVLLDVIGDIALTTVGTSLSDIFTLGGTSMEKFQKDGVAFFGAMKAIGEASAGITLDEESMNTIIGIAKKLAEFQSSLEPIEGVMDWLTGRDDLATFGTNAASFIGSMQTAMSALTGVEFNSDAMDQIISAATSLAGLQESLTPIESVLDWFKGKSDLGTFGANAASFIGSMQTAMSALTGVEFNSDAMDQIISAATSLAGLQESLTPIESVLDWFKGKSDLGTFGANAASFIGSMQTAMSSLTGVEFETGNIDTIISAAKSLAELQESLEPMEGVINWFKGKSDLGTFGTNIATFASAMASLKTGLGVDGIPASVTTSVTNCGSAINALQQALPTTSWFDGKMNLTTFSGYITDFGTAMSGFSSSASSIDEAAVSTTIDTAYRIKDFVNNISDLDTSKLSKLIGNTFSDGAIINIGQAMAEFSKEVADINIKAVSTSVSAATKLKDLTNSLADIDTSGVSSFNPKPIGESIKGYSDKVSGIDASAVTSSITTAYKVKSFITSLSTMNADGVSTFSAAVNDLSEVNFEGIISMVENYATTMQSSGATLSRSLNNGLKSGLSVIKNTVSNMMSTISSTIESKGSLFSSAGKGLADNLASGIRSGSNSASSAGSSLASSAADSAGSKSKYRDFYNAGSYLVDGFCSGINSNTWKAEAKAKAMAEAALEAAREVLDINSPSKEFKKLGASCVEGFSMGLSNLGNDINKPASEMAEVAIASTRSAMATVLDALNSDMDAQPTIRPVIDLSDVKTGADAISGLLNSTQTVGVRTNLNAINSAINANLQNGSNDDVISAINKLSDSLDNARGDTYTISGVTYDDGSNISDTIKTLVRYARLGGRV